jgi:TonB family protein
MTTPRRYLAQSASFALHVLGLIALLFLMNRAAAGVDPSVHPVDNKHLVYIAAPGSSGGGGGGSQLAAPRVDMEIPTSRPVAAVPVAVAQPTDPLPAISAPVVTNAASMLTASGVDGSVRVPFGGGGNGQGIGPGAGDGVGPGNATGFGGVGIAGEGGISAPIRIHEERPSYTPEAMRVKLQGPVEIQAIVDATGRVIEARVTQSLDRVFGLDEQARQAALRTLFQPCRKDGRPISCRITFVLTFTLR